MYFSKQCQCNQRCPQYLSFCFWVSQKPFLMGVLCEHSTTCVFQVNFFSLLKHHSNQLEGKCHKSSIVGGEHPPQSQEGCHGNRAPPFLLDNCQHLTKKTSMWNVYSHQTWKEQNQRIQVISNFNQSQRQRPYNPSCSTQIPLAKLQHCLCLNQITFKPLVNLKICKQNQPNTPR